MECSRRSVVLTLLFLSGCSSRTTKVLHAPERNSRVDKTGKWPFVRRNAQNMAYQPDGVSLSDPQLCWSTSFESEGTRYESPPVTTESHLLVNDYGDKFLEAVNPHDGSRRWSLKLPGRPEHSPCVVGNTGVVPAGEELLIIELDGGSIRHSTELGGVVGPPIVDQDTVFVATSDGNPKAYALSLSSGDIIWQYPIDIVTTPPAITGSTVMYTDWGGTVHAFDASDGDVRWQFRTQGEFIRSAPLVTSETVYICAGTNRRKGWVYAFDVQTGEKYWEKSVSDTSISASPAADLDTLYVVDDKSCVHALDLTTGERRWQTDGCADATPRQTVDQSPVVTDSRLYYLMGDGSFVAVSTANGRRRWRKKIDIDVEISPILMPNGVVLAGRHGIVCLCD